MSDKQDENADDAGGTGPLYTSLRGPMFLVSLQESKHSSIPKCVAWEAKDTMSLF